ncbi:MAG: three-Cys-motif partner protein TcmP [Chloroflexi bacterium]|nr:three-Cys-motif partner protein TcmP [Chloroflexota bacterium]
MNEFLDGSAVIAKEVTDRTFDRLLLIDIDADKVEDLRNVVEEREDSSRVQVIHGDANGEVEQFCKSMNGMDRAVVFLDPFGTQVSWSTVEALADSQKCDVWILYPAITLARLLPLDRKPQLPSRINTLNRVFGGKEWESLYYSSGQVQFIGEEEEMVRNAGIDEIVGLYSQKMQRVFAEVAPTRRTLRNSKGSPLYELVFAAGNPNGAPIAVDIAKHILQSL